MKIIKLLWNLWLQKVVDVHTLFVLNGKNMFHVLTFDFSRLTNKIPKCYYAIDGKTIVADMNK